MHYKSFESAELAHSSMNGRYFAGKQVLCDELMGIYVITYNSVIVHKIFLFIHSFKI